MGNFFMHRALRAVTTVKAIDSRGIKWLSISNDRDDVSIFVPSHVPIEKLEQIAALLGECFAPVADETMQAAE